MHLGEEYKAYRDNVNQIRDIQAKRQFIINATISICLTFLGWRWSGG